MVKVGTMLLDNNTRREALFEETIYVGTHRDLLRAYRSIIHAIQKGNAPHVTTFSDYVPEGHKDFTEDMAGMSITRNLKTGGLHVYLLSADDTLRSVRIMFDSRSRQR